MTIFLLLVVVIYFGLLLIYNFNTVLVSGITYLLVIPVSIIHYYKIKKNFKSQYDYNNDHEDIL